MAKFAAADAIGCSANNESLAFLACVAQDVYEGKIHLEQSEKPFSTLSNSPDLDFKKVHKGILAPRKKQVVWSALGVTMKESNRSKKLPKTRANRRSDPVSELPEEIKKRILDHGGDPKSGDLIIQKELTRTDVSNEHGKLSMRYNQVSNKFLEQIEVKKLDEGKGEVRVVLIQPCLEACEISLRNWKSNSEYALIQDWKEVCQRNALKNGTKINLWSFRRNLDNRLCFALVKDV